MGTLDSIRKQIEELAAKQPSKKMTTELGYFVRHGREEKRMEYARLEKAGLPADGSELGRELRRQPLVAARRRA